MTTTLWLLGTGGLLGSAVRRAVERRPEAERPDLIAPSVPWHDPTAARRVFDDVVDDLNRRLAPVSTTHEPPADEARLHLAWCAGAGVVGTSPEQFELEGQVVDALVASLARLDPRLLAATTVFVSSSAGAVYAGGGDAPHDEFSPTGALVPYGTAKLKLEAAFTDFAQQSSARVVLGRIANLYGPGQNLGKGQGLISTLLWGALTGSPVKVYVDLDTVRDYVFVDDAAQMVLACLDRASTAEPGSATVKVIATGQRVTVGQLLHLSRRLGSQRPLVVQGASPLRSGQAKDLSLRSRVWPEIDRLATTPLLVGAHRTFLDLQRTRLEAAHD